MKFGATIQIFYNFEIQKRIFSAETIWGNMVYTCRYDKHSVNSFAQKVAAENPPLTKLSEEPKNAKNSQKLSSEEDTSFQAISGIRIL